MSPVSDISENKADLAAACALIGIAVERGWLAGGAFSADVEKCTAYLAGRSGELSGAREVAEKATALLTLTGLEPESEDEVTRLFETRSWPLLMERVPLDVPS